MQLSSWIIASLKLLYLLGVKMSASDDGCLK